MKAIALVAGVITALVATAATGGEQRLPHLRRATRDCPTAIALLLAPANFGVQGGLPDGDCRYPLEGMVAFQRVPGGYLVRPDPAQFDDGYYHVAFLRTTLTLGRGERLSGWVQLSGVYTYTALDGMESETYAFRPSP